MKQILKQNKYHVFMVLLILAFVYSCQHDDTTQNEQDTQQQKVLDLTARKIKTHTLFKQNKNVDKFITKNLINKAKNNLSSSIYNFSIDTTNVQVISADTFESYTFIVEREEEENIVENYVLTVFDNGSYTQMLAKYPYTINEYDIEYDFANATANYLTDDSLVLSKLSNSPCPSQSQEILEFQDNGCLPVNCGLEGDHPPSQPCEDGVQRSYLDCDIGWVVVGCVQTSSGAGGSGTGPFGSPAGGSSNTGNDNNSDVDSEVPVLPFVDLLTRAECNKIRDLFQEYPNYRQEVIGLNSKTNLNHETAVGIYENGTTFEQAGDANNYLVNLPLDPPSKYRTISHVHNEFTSATDTITTYSTFSVGDLEFVAKRMREDEVHNDFVGFLTTGKGTKYAFTINNRTKFKKFFKYLDILEESKNGNIETATELSLYFNTVVSPIYDKYYDKLPPNPAPIRVDNNNNHQVLVAFANFLKEADMGVTLFEADTNFTTFKKVTANEHGTTVVRENCNE